MLKLAYTNSLGHRLEFYGRPYRLISFTGLGDVNIQHSTQRGFKQDGVSRTASLLEPRNMNIQLKIVGKDSDDVAQKRQELLMLFNQRYGEGTLEYISGDDYKAIKCIIDAVPFFPDGSKNRGEDFQRVLIDLFAPNPYWEDGNATDKFLNTIEPTFSFPLEIIDEGIELSIISPGTATLNNTGAVDTPLNITIYGPAEVPALYNDTTGEFIKVKRNIQSNEKMIISTEFGNKKVEIHEDDGTIRNVFNYIDLDSVFFMLKPGLNTLRFSAAVGSDAARVSFNYRRRYIGI